MSNELSLGSPDAVANIAFDRVHRLGARRRYSDKPRPIVAKFERFTDRETIRKAGMVLNNRPNSTYRVREQFPKEIEDRRKVLYSALYRLKSNPQNRISLVRDKLYVNGQLYIPENDPEFRPPPQRTSYSKPNRQTTSISGGLNRNTQVNRMSKSRRVLATGGKQRSFGLHMVCFEMVLYHNEPH